MSASQKRLEKLLSHLQTQATTAQQTEVVWTKVLPSGVGIITLNNPPVNSLPHPVLYAIDKAAREFQTDPNIKAVIITGQKRFFCGGADINLLKKSSQSNSNDSLIAAAHPILNNIEDGTKPFIAAINGFALGGGCELAMGCHYRIMSQTASIGLVEANLGLIPGFGGTQRLPRLMGFSDATYAIVTGKQFSATHAQRKGIVDEVCEPNELLRRAEIVALEFANKKRIIRRALYCTDKLPTINVAQQQMNAMKKRFSKLFHESPAAEYALTAIMGVYQGPKQGLQVEEDTFNAIIKSPSAKAQLHLFFAQRATTKIDIPIKGKMSRSIQQVAVLGGGTMGSGICAILLAQGFVVILKEINDAYATIAYKRVSKIVKRFEAKGILKNKSADEILSSRLKVQTNYNGFDALDMVIEAVLEQAALKQTIFRELVKVCNDTCILATNTSTIDLNQISHGLPLSAQRRMVGLHFFSPPHIMRLVEIIRTESTAPVIVSDMVKICKRLRKLPVVVGNCVGFAANRMFFPYCQAAQFLVEHGVNPYRIDRVLQQFGMKMGVFKMMDLSGIDIFNHVEDEMRKAYTCCYDSSLLKELVRLNCLGQKTKHGVYVYDDKRNTFADENGMTRVLFNINNRKQFKFKWNRNELSDEDIAHMCLFPAVNEAFKILSEGYAHKSSDLDIVSTQGYGFPKKRGGLYFWAVNEVGLKQVVSKLQQWANTFNRQDPNLNLSRFFSPCDALRSAAERV